MKKLSMIIWVGFGLMGCSTPSVNKPQREVSSEKADVNYDDLANPFVEPRFIEERFGATPLVNQNVIPWRGGYGPDLRNLFKAEPHHCVVAIEKNPAIEYQKNVKNRFEGCAWATQRIEVLIKNKKTEQLEVHRSMAHTSVCTTGQPLMSKDLDFLTHKALEDKREDVLRNIAGLEHCEGWGIK